jgi:hypothetical protein
MPSLHIHTFPRLTHWLFVSVFVSLTPASPQSLEDILSNLATDGEESVVSEEELEILEAMVHRPVNLNKATKADLRRIPLLTSGDIDLILRVKAERTSFSNVEAASEIPGLSLAAAQLLPIIAALENRAAASITLRNRWASSQGDFRILNRALLTSELASGGIVIERDPLEPTFADYVSAHGRYATPGGTEIIMGDHRIESGYGLLFGRIARPMKGGWQVTAPGRIGSGLQSYRSAAEQWGLRGVAVRSKQILGRWTASLSSSPVDAVMDEGRVVSVQRSGLHNSAATIARKHNVREEIIVLNWETPFAEKGQLGATAATSDWRGVDGIHQIGDHYFSQYGQAALKNGSLFWEGAARDGGRPAWIAGLSQSTKVVRWLTLIRAYPSGWRGPRSRPFSEWSGDWLNESGVYQAVSAKLGRFRIASYGDVYQRSAGQPPAHSPVKGSETALLANYRFSAGNQLQLRWKREEKSDESQITFADETVQRGYSRAAFRLQADRKLNENLSFRIRLDHVEATDGGDRSDGQSLSLSGNWDRRKTRLSLHWITFNTTDYASRIYVWNLNLPGEMRSRAYSGEGHSIGIRYSVRSNTGASVAFRLRGLWHKIGNAWSAPAWEGGFQMDIAL